MQAATLSGAEAVWTSSDGFRWSELKVSESGRSGFSVVTPEQTGVAFKNVLSEEAIAANRVLANGSGVAVGDFDGDGLPDLYLCGLESSNALYRNLGGWKFEDVTDQAGVACANWICRGAVFADLNGDGSLDLLVSTLSEGALCFLNNGAGRFSDATATAGTKSDYAPTTMALADIDGNGTLDLYVADYRPNDIRDRGRLNIPIVDGKPSVPAALRNRLVFLEGRAAEYGQPDQLFLNDGNGRFREVRWDDGTFLDEQGQKLTSAPLDWGLTAAFRDLNHDSAPDLYVCNDYWTPDRLWINDGKGTFRAIETVALRKTCGSSMGIDFGDFDRDGELDFFAMDMLSRKPYLRKRQNMADKPETTPLGVVENRPQVMRNTLFKNDGDGTYSEISHYANLHASDWSWSPICMDVDLDGFEDLIISSGHFRDVQDMDAAMQIQARQHSWSGFPNEAARQKAYTQELLEHYRLYPFLKMPVIGFRNLGNWKFQETTEPWGLNHERVRHGIATGDFDGDGDLDLVANVLNGTADLFRNESSAGRVIVRLKGKAPNSEGIGAKVTLRGGAVPVQSTEIVSGGHYLSGSQPVAVFATGEVKAGMTIEVRWRGGLASVIPDVRADRAYEIDEAKSGKNESPQRAGDSAPSLPLFEDVSDKIDHAHHETEFNDFERQPLLPFKWSQQSPGAAWFDLTGDGHDDLIVGTGSGGEPAVFQSDGAGKFAKLNGTPSFIASSDLAGIVGWTGSGGRREVLFGVTGYETTTEHGAERFRAEENRLIPGGPAASAMSSASALALGDPNGNGQLVLFVGGGVSPGQYPLGAASKLYKHDGTQWLLDARNSVLLERLGIVNGAVWSDLDADGLSELVIACEWGAIRVFQSRGGLLFDVTEEWGLSRTTGWWKGVTTGDLNGDGKLDIIASNWGENSPYRASPEKPLVFVYGQLAQPGVTDVIETEYDAGGNLTPRHPIMTLAPSLPFLFEQFANHRAYSEATLDQVLGARKALGRRVEITTLLSTVFINRGGRFEAVPLPAEAQFAPAFGVNVGDIDGDGNEDLFLSQNFFATRPEMPRIDAGRGLVLRGDGKGEFKPVPAIRSGIRVYGEQRGSALGDFDEDGRIDLVVTQNAAATKLFRNIGAKPGLRVRLNGSALNPSGIGAVIRLQFGTTYGPAREVHCGSGYWSQDSLVQVMGTPSPPAAVQVRWPGGRVTSTPVGDGMKEITIDPEGNAKGAR